MHRVNTYYPKSEPIVSPNLNGHPSIPPHEDKNSQTLSETGRDVTYGHTIADVEQQILDWLKGMENNRK